MSTLLQEGIEFVLPGLYKAYRREHAEDFKHGKMYFTNINKFRKDENTERGDSLECQSNPICQGVHCTVDYHNPIYIWCATMETDPSLIIQTWKDRDTLLQITDTLEFARRVRDASVPLKSTIRRLIVGPVTYDKDEGSYREEQWAKVIFQKNLRFSHQKEFRFALVGDWCIQHELPVILELGDCADIARIVEG